MRAKSLGDARRLFRARKFPEVIRALEPEVFRFRESFDFYLLLGMSCLRTGDLGGAYSYLGRARQLNAEDERIILGLAAIHFKKGETDKALALWLECLESEPSNAVAKRGMGLLRKGLTREQMQDFADSGRMASLYPPLPPRIGLVKTTISISVVLIAACISYFAYRALRPVVVERPGISEVEIPPDLPRLIEAGTGSSRFTLTERQVSQAFRDAKRYLIAFRDNMAAVEINRILLSNATVPVKERARMLKAFIAAPDFTTFKDGFSYRDVVKEPALYDMASVVWSGKIANVAFGKDAIRFDLLVGYAQEKELEGIVPVTMGFAAELADGDPYEILARVSSEDGSLRLECISLHRLVSP
jgi:tetratricopeptide (TPR) repeat protein